jgi:NAD+ synthase (glutamine-hydrolysing)
MNAERLARQLNVTLKVIKIDVAVKNHLKDIGHKEGELDVTFENAQARERTQILMDIANENRAIVIGTGDLSEIALGWNTFSGDHISMYNVNAGVPKTLVKYIIQWCSEERYKGKISEVLKDIIETPISPELLPPDSKGKIKQKTEEIIGPFELHDFYLYYFIRFGFSPRKIQLLAELSFESKYSKVEIRKWLNVFIKRFFTNQFKRNCIPDGPKIGTVALSPRGDWRMPSDAESQLWLK